MPVEVRWIASLAVAAIAVLVLPLGAQPDAGEALPKPGDRLRPERVVRFARLALANIAREYPNKPSNVMVGPESVRSPREMHPAFYGCFDWHSSVHGHWMLVRLLRLYPDTAVRDEIVEALDANLTAENLSREADYFAQKHNRSFERPYGWAWLLQLAAELRTWDDPRARRWAAHLVPLERRIVGLAKAYLPRLTWPIRTGEHPDTGFALALMIDYGRAVGDDELVDVARARARRYYADDVDYPTRYEPSGQDFFSSGLNEADLMRRVLDAPAYGAWLDRFFPGLARGEFGNLARPAAVSDVTDGKLVHLAGLNLNRAWTMRGIASALAPDDPRRAHLERAVAAHTRVGLGYVFSGHYEGEHWLASFAVYLLTDRGIGE